MTTKEENERLCLVDDGTEMGTLFRHYWLPIALHEELPEADCPPIRVDLLGEELVAFRDSNGVVGLIDAHCPHRNAPLFFGRNEECGLRCVYHGWKFDLAGECVDMPSEPDYSKFKLTIKIKAYPTWEGGGLIWAFLGAEDAVPPKPNYEWIGVPDTHRSVGKALEDCNYLQCVEGGIDTAHSSFLHRRFGKEPGLRERDKHPKIELEMTDFGMHCASLREVGDGRTYVRVTNYLMPSMNNFGQLIDDFGNRTPAPMATSLFWVPMDNTTTAIYNVSYRLDGQPLAPGAAEDHVGRFGIAAADRIPGTYWNKANRSNDYLIDREAQRTKSYTGIEGIGIQDYAVQEGMGKITDRSTEHLGSSDTAIIAARELLLEAMDEVKSGKVPKGVDPAAQRRVRPADKFLDPGMKWREAVADELYALV